MPLERINCAAPKYRSKGQKHQVTIDDCLDCAASRENTCHFTYELLSSMYEAFQNRGLDHISTTTLTTKCLRSERLKRGGSYAEDPEDLWPAFRGTMYHGQLERHAAPGCIEEARYHVDLPGLGHLSGSPDLIDVSQGILYDYKTNKENPRFNYPWRNHVEQLQVNRWLVDHAKYVEYRGKEYMLRPTGSTEDSAQARENRARFCPRVWNSLVIVYIDDKGPKPLEVTKSVDVPTKDGASTKKQRVPDIWSDEQAEAFIRERYESVLSAFSQSTVPPIPGDMEGWNHPLCNYCSVRADCIDAHFEEKYTGTPVTIGGR